MTTIAAVARCAGCDRLITDTEPMWWQGAQPIHLDCGEDRS